MSDIERLCAQAILQAMALGKDLENDLDGHVKVSAITCLYCETISQTYEAAKAHDGECTKHPMAQRVIALEAQLAERDAEIVRMNKIWDDAVDYGARVRGALVETRKALVTAKDFLWRNISTDKAVEIRGVADVVLAKYKSLAGED